MNILKRIIAAIAVGLGKTVEPHSQGKKKKLSRYERISEAQKALNTINTHQSCKRHRYDCDIAYCKNLFCADDIEEIVFNGEKIWVKKRHQGDSIQQNLD